MSVVNPSAPGTEESQDVLLLRRRLAGWSTIPTFEHVGHATIVRQYATSAGPIFVKSHRRNRKYIQEKQAYLHWSPYLCTPRLLDFDNGGRALMLGAVRGRSGDRHPLPAEAYRAAGRWLRTLHSIESDDTDPVPWNEALAERLSALEVRAAPHLEASEVAAILDPVKGQLTSSPTIRRVPCHRDFDPRNWMYDGQTLNVLDFEHARLDAAPWDITRLAGLWWPGEPQLRTAFAEGYGPVDDQFWPWVEALTAMDGLATLVWGLSHGDSGFIARGRRVLDRPEPTNQR